MPTVFSPGEPETRPLDPDAIVYTTGNKVAELLGIAAGEPVLAAADTASTGFYITEQTCESMGLRVVTLSLCLVMMTRLERSLPSQPLL
jgi:hypothetical protein